MSMLVLLAGLALLAWQLGPRRLPITLSPARVPGASLKVGVDDSRLRPEALDVVRAAVLVAGTYGPVVVTSTYEGRHLPESRHYDDLAVDLRSSHLASPEVRARYRDAVRARLPRGYDVLSEGPGGPAAGYDRDADAPHLHGEWDPHRVGVG